MWKSFCNWRRRVWVRRAYQYFNLGARDLTTHCIRKANKWGRRSAT